MAPASSGSKAFFTNVDTGSVFFVQFNPKEFKLDEKANWKASDEHENDVPLLTYEKGEPTVVTMDLVFDSTDDGTDVYKKYVEPLRDFLTADVNVSDNEGDKMKRPPFCQFTWASFTFHCVVEKISATCLMFKPDGTALRAKVQVGLKERVRNVNGGGTDSVTLSAVGSMFSGAAGKANTYTIQHGDTLSSVAAKTKAKARDIARANNIADPINLPPGKKLVIPADSKLADILAQQGKRKQDGNWQGPPSGPGPRARGGYLGGAPSTFDEVVGLDYDVDPGGIAAQYMSFSKMDYDVRGDSE
ncbi:MAG: LysM peptidoglycan-binding domain-containing protein, partial [Alphaproteobacteria bacterium]|nr:LysM peptidoglycan-binding domain-containing protein [Alphaproteobacteria bacterium]